MVNRLRIGKEERYAKSQFVCDASFIFLCMRNLSQYVSLVCLGDCTLHVRLLPDKGVSDLNDSASAIVVALFYGNLLSNRFFLSVDGALCSL